MAEAAKTKTATKTATKKATKKAPKKMVPLNEMWKYFRVEVDFIEKVMGGVPKEKNIVAVWIESIKMKTETYDRKIAQGLTFRPLEESVNEANQGREDVNKEAEENEVSAEELRTWVGFLRDEEDTRKLCDDSDADNELTAIQNKETGYIYASRAQIRGHLKDCAYQVREMTNVSGWKNLIISHVFIVDERIYFKKNGEKIHKVDGNYEHYVNVPNKFGGKTSALKRNDIIMQPSLSFTLQVLHDGKIKPEYLQYIFEYGGLHGMFAERGQGHGKYQGTVYEVDKDGNRIPEKKKGTKKKETEDEAETEDSDA